MSKGWKRTMNILGLLTLKMWIYPHHMHWELFPRPSGYHLVQQCFTYLGKDNGTTVLQNIAPSIKHVCEADIDARCPSTEASALY